eukprot:7929134-Prorocentrum_lima.AAC.1
MTSSLVGSEMCIRDSPSRPSSSCLFIVLLVVLVALLLAFVFLVVIAPVSYTHLTLPTICSV